MIRTMDCIRCGETYAPDMTKTGEAFCSSVCELVHISIEPTSPSVAPVRDNGQIYWPDAAYRVLQQELILRNQDIEDLRLTNRNLSRKIVEDARKLGYRPHNVGGCECVDGSKPCTSTGRYPRGIHGS